MMSSAMPSAKNSCSGSLLMLVYGSTAIDGSSGRGNGSGEVGHRRSMGAAFVANPVRPHWSGNVLRLLLAQILEGVIQPIAYLVANNPADTDPPGFGQRLQPRRYVHTVAEDVLFLDNHVTEVDAHAKPDLPLLGQLGL